MTLARTLADYPTTVVSGTYTPSLSNVNNSTGRTAAVCQFSRVEDVVTVSGTLTSSATTAATMSISITLPVSSAMSNATQCAGTANSAAGTASGVIIGDSSTDRAVMVIGSAPTASTVYYFTFTYRII